MNKMSPQLKDIMTEDKLRVAYKVWNIVKTDPYCCISPGEKMTGF
jgi:hypothetical protein